jgi:hypothetical protein
MDAGIGTTLRETRIRRRVDLAAVEDETKIRVRYLRALENEEWDVLPGGAYTRSFIRTYATYLGLDAERLSDEYRRTVEEPDGDRLHEPAGPMRPQAPGGGGPRFQISRGALAALISVGLMVILVGIGLAGGGGGSDSTGSGSHKRGAKAERKQKATPATPKKVKLHLSALGDVWVCLLDANGAPLVNGQILTAGAEEGPFRSGRFTVSFGNGEVAMRINGEDVGVQESPNPVGYEIGKGGKLRPLTESARPTCT